MRTKRISREYREPIERKLPHNGRYKKMDEHLCSLWKLIYAEIPNHLKISDDTLKLWFYDIELKFISENNKIYFAIDNYLKKTFIETHGRYFEAFSEAIEAVLDMKMIPVLICTEKESFDDQFARLAAKESGLLKEGYVVNGEDYESKEAYEEYQRLRKEDEANKYLERMHDVFPPEPEIQKEKPKNLNDAIRNGINAPRRYNKGIGRIEEIPISKKYLDDDDGGMLMMSSSAPISYPSYTFENFVVGSANRFAYQYALQAARYPAQQYNPLYIYGAPGLGKTHLLYAIINETMRLNPSFNIIYVKGEDFTNELVEAIQKRTPLQFRDKYRNADVLLVDDVQFIAGKDSTQEEFFHTYNALYETNKQIIITSDKPPKDIAALEERLRSRFEGGPVVKIDPPDIELRTAIIKKKFELMRIDVPNEVILFLSENIKDNVRQIEGAVKKLNAFCVMTHQKITLDIAKAQISDIVTFSSTIDKQRVMDAVSEKYGVTQDEILGKHKTKEIAWARHIAIYAMKRLTDMTYSDIGRYFKRDHSTIMTAVSKMEKESAEHAEIEREIQDIIELIRTSKN